MRAQLVRSARDSLLTLSAICGLAAITALIVALDDPARERAELHWGFAGVPHEITQTVSIVQANLSVLGPLLVMAVLVQARSATATERGGRVFKGFCDTVAALPVLHNLILVLGVAVGAYGTRMLRAMVPYGPVELTAFALAASVYLASRSQRLTRRELPPLAAISAASAATLVVAALLETYA